MNKHVIKHFWLIAVLLASVGLNLAQMKELSRLRETQTSKSVLPAGSPAIPIVAHDLDGNPRGISYDSDLPVIVYVFSPRCGWCSRNLDNIAALAAQTSGRYRLIGLSVISEGLKDLVQQQGWKFPVYSKPSREVFSHFRIGSTPHTLVISRGGKVLHSWTGAYDGKTMEEIQAALEVQLPGLKK